MKFTILPDIDLVGVRDVTTTHFEKLMPLPDGTSYNSYLITTTEGTVLVDAVLEEYTEDLLRNIGDVSIDYLIVNHAEQDHTGAIPKLLEIYPSLNIITNKKCAEFLQSMYIISDARFLLIEDGEEKQIGNKTFVFILTPWVHWPETMCTYVKEDQILFSCDLFGAHDAHFEVFPKGKDVLYATAKRYFAEVMQPFRTAVLKSIAKLSSYDISLIAPSHGPVHNEPAFIQEAYAHWAKEDVDSLVVIPYVSMYHTTEIMVKELALLLEQQHISVQLFDMTQVSIGELSMALLDANCVIFAGSAFLIGPHPVLKNAMYLTDILKPKTRVLSFVGSYDWATANGRTFKEQFPSLKKVSFVEPLLIKGAFKEEHTEQLSSFATTIVQTIEERFKKE